MKNTDNFRIMILAPRIGGKILVCSLTFLAIFLSSHKPIYSQSCSPPMSIQNNSGTSILNCNKSSISLTAVGGHSYEWSNSLGNLPTVSVTAPGLYSVTITNTAGCTSVESINISQNITPPDFTIQSIDQSGTPNDNTICKDGSATLSVPFGHTYSWNTGDSLASINVTQSGTYSVTLTNSSGCSASSSIQISKVIFSPTLSVTESSGRFVNDGIICIGDSARISVSSGISYTWSTGATTSNIRVVSQNDYFVTVTGTAGCTETLSRGISVNQISTTDFEAQEVCRNENPIDLRAQLEPLGISFSGESVGGNIFTPSSVP